jgi:DNA-binding MarR family transcriptional regulator
MDRGSTERPARTTVVGGRTGGDEVADTAPVAAYRLLIADVFELAGTSRRTSELLAESLGQTAARWHVMSVVSAEARTVPAIADRLGQVRQSVQRVVNDLVGEGLVELRANRAHVRSPLVALTGEGRRLTGRHFADSERNRADLLDRAGVDATDLLAARATLRSVLDAFGDAEPG